MIENDGRLVGTRTPDLYRVNVTTDTKCNSLQSIEGRKSGVRKQRLCRAVLLHDAHFKDHYPVDSVFFVVGAESVPRVTLNRVAGYRRSTEEHNDAQLFAQSRTLRIRQVDGLNLSTVIATSPLRCQCYPNSKAFS